MIIRNIFFYFFILFCSCAKNKSTDYLNISKNYGNNDGLDIVSWNIERFPKENSKTISYLVELIRIMNIDVIALQEIRNQSSFDTLITRLGDEWGGYRSNFGSGWNLAYLYNKSQIIKTDIYEIYTNDSYAFPRAPLVLELIYKSENIIIINNHLKAFDELEDKNRRQLASNKLKIYIDQMLNEDNVIVLGDFNDELIDVENNIFQNFINDSINFKFADIDIAFGPSYNWSYPQYPSHLDHILITNELFDEFININSKIETINLDNYFFEGWIDYEKYISDHRPIMISLIFNP